MKNLLQRVPAQEGGVGGSGGGVDPRMAGVFRSLQQVAGGAGRGGFPAMPLFGPRR